MVASRERRSSGAFPAPDPLPSRSEGASSCARTRPRSHRPPHRGRRRLDLGDGGEDAAFEQACRDYLSDLRWPGGVECPRCSESSRLLWLTSRSKWHCYACRYQFSVTAGTLFHSSHLPVWKWFVAIHLMLSCPDGVSANELRRTLGGSYKTAWFAAHRIRSAMRGEGADLLRTSSRRNCTPPVRLTPRARRSVPGQGNRRLPDATARRRPAQPAEHQVLARVHRRAALAFREPLEPSSFQDTIKALLQGDGISYEQLVAARVGSRLSYGSGSPIRPGSLAAVTPISRRTASTSSASRSSTTKTAPRSTISCSRASASRPRWPRSGRKPWCSAAARASTSVTRAGDGGSLRGGQLGANRGEAYRASSGPPGPRLRRGWASLHQPRGRHPGRRCLDRRRASLGGRRPRPFAPDLGAESGEPLTADGRIPWAPPALQGHLPNGSVGGRAGRAARAGARPGRPRAVRPARACPPRRLAPRGAGDTRAARDVLRLLREVAR